jgi:ABC-type cobalamin/Fe3+-siderophores transport system ATPase subunit
LQADPKPAHDCVLQVSHLSVNYQGRLVLDDISFSLQRGDVLTILGPNGAGKTVLLRALLGTIPHEGAIAWGAGAKIYANTSWAQQESVSSLVSWAWCSSRSPGCRLAR